MKNKIINTERSDGTGVTYFDFTNGDTAMIVKVPGGYLCEYADGSGWVIHEFTETKKTWLSAWWYIRQTGRSFDGGWD